MTHEAQTVRLDMSAVDSPGGIRAINATLSAPDGDGQSQSAYYDDVAPHITDPVGSSVEFRISRYTPPGQYRWQVTVGDGAGFHSTYGQGGPTFPGGFSGTLSVMNSGLTRGTPPVASGFSRHPALLPEGALPGLLEYTVQASDPAAIGAVTGFLIKSPVTTGSGRNEFQLKLIGGTPQNGTWRGRVKLSRNNLPGDYVTGFRLTDQTGDTATYGAWPGDAVPYPVPWDRHFSITAGGPPLTAYQSWRLGYFSGDDANAGEAGDPDGDGWPNALEFMLEMDPWSPSPAGVDDPTTGLPRIFWNPVNFRMEYRLSQLHPTLGTGTDLKLKAWKSTTLGPGSWSPVVSVPQSTGQRYFQLDSPGHTRDRQFLRMTAEP